MNELDQTRKIEEKLKGHNFLDYEGFEWAIDVQGNDEYIARRANSKVNVFANNGFGDTLFFKVAKNNTVSLEKVFVFWHEGPEIENIDYNLDELLEILDRPASRDEYPPARYTNGDLVKVGDEIEFRSFASLWLKKELGVVDYVPGFSPKKEKHEYNGLKWVSTKGKNGIDCEFLVNPDTGITDKLRKRNN